MATVQAVDEVSPEGSTSLGRAGPGDSAPEFPAKTLARDMLVSSFLPDCLLVTKTAPSTPMRERILRAAPDIIQRFTVAKFSMEDVARATGIARQTIYKHFKNKDSLLIEIYVRQMRDRHDPVMAKVISRKPSAANLVRIFMTELNAARSFSLFDQTLDPKVAPFMAELCLNSAELMSAREATWFPILKRYQAEGVCVADLDAKAAVRWITYQEFWFLTHPTVLCRTEHDLELYVRNFIVPALVVSAS